MKMNDLGRTGIRVSRICLGTMTFGEQNSEAESHAMMDLAADHGVNFLDTAEMYAFPSSPETCGRSEEIVGTWMKARGNRADMVIATKICGPGERFRHIRGGDIRFDRSHILRAVDGSLKRLQTDYIDLYQTHWPERPANYFGSLGYVHDDTATGWTPFEETLEAMADEIKAGRVRAFGVSNETAWGLMRILELADRTGLPRAVTIQNPYNLLCRHFEVGLAEAAIREDCGLLAYSPLAFGALTGKYLGGRLPQGSRVQLFPEFKRYFNPAAVAATQAYSEIARDAGLDMAEMALSYVNSRRFLTSTIIGATTLGQLETDLGSEGLVLSGEVLDKIEAVHDRHPSPAP